MNRLAAIGLAALLLIGSAHGQDPLRPVKVYSATSQSIAATTSIVDPNFSPSADVVTYRATIAILTTSTKVKVCITNRANATASFNPKDDDGALTPGTLNVVSWTGVRECSYNLVTTDAVVLSFISVEELRTSIAVTSSGRHGSAQTPWTTNVDGGGFNLSNVSGLTVDGRPGAGIFHIIGGGPDTNVPIYVSGGKLNIDGNLRMTGGWDVNLNGCTLESSSLTVNGGGGAGLTPKLDVNGIITGTSECDCQSFYATNGVFGHFTYFTTNLTLGNGTAAINVTGTPMASWTTSGASLAGITSANVSATLLVRNGTTVVTLTDADCFGQDYVTTGAVGMVEFDLPATPAEGDLVTFVADGTTGLKVKANTSCRIRSPAQLTGAAGYFYTNRHGSEITVQRVSATEWHVVRISGTWQTDSVTAGHGFAYTPTAWAAATCTTNGWVDANHTTTAKWMQVGNQAHVVIQVAVTGTVTTASLSVNPPTEFAVDESTITWSQNTNLVGTCTAFDVAVGQHGGIVTYVASSQHYLIPYTHSGASGLGQQVTNAVPYTQGNNDYVFLDVWLPVAP